MPQHDPHQPREVGSGLCPRARGFAQEFATRGAIPLHWTPVRQAARAGSTPAAGFEDAQ